jgi:hypothetical protein
MTETEWLSFTDPGPMWLVIRERLSVRKIRLFGVAFCGILRRTPQFRDAVVFEPWAERVADGLMSLDAAWDSIRSEWGEDHFFRGLLEDDPSSGRGVPRILALSGLPTADEDAQRLGAAHDFIRCIAGNPFHPVAVDPVWLAWKGGTVAELAQGIYEDRAFDRLPILADALEDAGCSDTAILDHCRGPGPHARGCWVVDLLLGKS